MKKYMLLILFLFISSVSFSQLSWMWMHPRPQGNALHYVKIFNSNNWIAVGDFGTFMKTTNAGQNWYINHNADGFKPDNYSTLYDAWFFNMSTGIVCGASSQVWRTTNGGLTFDSIPVALGNAANFMGIHFINSNTGYIGCSIGDVFKTTDAGLSWSRIFTGSNLWIQNISAADNRIYCPGTQSSILTSYDKGETWFVNVVSSTQYFLNDVKFIDTLRGMVCGINFAAYTSNGGASWQQCNATLASSSFYSVIYSRNKWYLTGNPNWIYRSSNNGITWDSLDFHGNQFYSSAYLKLDIRGVNFLTGGNFGLLNSSTNNGLNWNSFNYLGNRAYLLDIWCDNMNGKVIAAGTSEPTPFLVSSNGGNNWIYNSGTGITNQVNSLSMINSMTGYACGTFGKVLRTNDGGLNWDSVTSVDRVSLVNIDFVSQDTGFVCEMSGKIYRTENGGLNWLMIYEPIPHADYKIDMVNSKTGWIAGGNGNCMHTSNGGFNWIEQSVNTSSSIRDLQIIDQSTGFIAGYGGLLRKTTNGGTNWDTVRTPYNINFLSVSFINANTGYVAGYYGNTARTSDGGQSWEIKKSGSNTIYSVFCKGYDSAYIAGTGAMILKQYNSLTGGITWQHEVPHQYELYQNYPNPFNPNTIIKFAIPNTSKVSLKVHDILGREVKILMDNIEMNAGTVTCKFDASSLASGVYFYTLIVNNNKIDTRKMLFLK